MTWTSIESNTHQDHVIAHVIGATSLGHFIWDETAYLLLDIGFIWNIYLDMDMGLVPQAVAIREVNELRSFAAELETGTYEPNPIKSVELFENGDKRRLVGHCEHRDLIIETSLNHRW